MTREEASEILSDEEISFLIRQFHGGKVALDLALSALRPVSREQVEKVWRGELKENLSSSYKNEITYCAECGHDFFDFTQIRNFCPVCGKALTDKAVQMVMERMEVLHDNRT